MSKKHYIVIAEIIKEVNEDIQLGESNPVSVMHSVTQRLADFFKEDNANFNRETFFNACEC